MRKILKYLFVFGMSASLAACIDVDQKITLVKDQLTYTAEIKVDAKIAAISNNENGKICDNFQSRNYDGISFETKETSGGGNIICSIAAKGPIDKFNNFSNTGKNNSETVRVTAIDKNKYKIESTLDFQSNTNNDDGTQGMMDAMLAGRNVSWSVSAPKVLESNGKIAEDGKSVTWSVPMSVAFRSPQNFYAIIQKESSFFDDIIDFFKRILDSILGIFKSAPAKSASSPLPSTAPASLSQPVTAETNTPVITPRSEVQNETSQTSTPPPATSPTSSAEALQAAQPVPVDSAKIEVSNQDFAPSFDCLKANSGQDRLVCGDKKLAELDVKLSVLYSKARSNTLDKDTLKQDQIQWYKYQRNACSDVECLINAYQSRIAELSHKP